MTNTNPNKIYNARKYVSSSDKVKVGDSLLGRRSKSCQINCHGACNGRAKGFRLCKCQCHLLTLRGERS